MPNYLPSLKRLLRLLAVLVGVWVCAVALLGFCIPAEPARPDPFRLAAPALGEPAPDFTLRDVEGRPFRLSGMGWPGSVVLEFGSFT
jgi:cytochrome oxidase Cu insertion factor (SCO1/SenC/PrrC family)